ncbi:toprim domain-containing protein [Rheinheimera baltica]|uniref:Toprim domain-containing protein n=2 Tax=Rheinheimera baltica TaxID=67576 RepID=A0ABT9I490_9GAMM|nr:toprim domain-containing protein [Rheinheimera baltica]MDP5137928.1 toprim domain-containing protein [Rheinheimera baltica]
MLLETPPGKIQRFEIVGDKKGNLNGWLISFNNGYESHGYVFGSWKLGSYHTFSSNKTASVDRLNLESARREANRSQEEQQRQVANACYEQWKRAEPAARHPYLARKGIQAHIAKVDTYNRLLIPVVDMAGQLTSLQYIKPTGCKLFSKGGKKSGCFCPLGYGESASTILVCEGFATGATLREATGLPVIVAFDAGNLKPVTMSLRLQHPHSKIIICADNDHLNRNQNVGLNKATEAAKCSGAYMIYPGFAANDNGTDFNDLAVTAGLDGIQKIIQEVAA